MKVKVAVIYGGQSDEHIVSCVSAGNVIKNLDPKRYEIVMIGISDSGRWVRTGENDIVVNFASPVQRVSDDAPAVRLVSREHAAIEPDDRAIEVDVAIPMLHGKNGEDGTVQGLLELAGIPYVGSGVLGSAVAMDKGIAKQLLDYAGLPVGPFQYFDYSIRSAAGITACEQAWQRLGPVVFVKPSRGGSSVGIERAANLDQYVHAFHNALNYDSRVIVEQAIKGREIEIAVLEWPDGTVTASTPAEVSMPAEQTMYDFSSKYEKDVATITIPAPIAPHHSKHMQDIALEAFRVLQCRGLARVDFFLTESGPLINEINTIPGFTPVSQYPRMLAYDGLSYPELLDTLIATARKYPHK